LFEAELCAGLIAARCAGYLILDSTSRYTDVCLGLCEAKGSAMTTRIRAFGPLCVGLSIWLAACSSGDSTANLDGGDPNSSTPPVMVDGAVCSPTQYFVGPAGDDGNVGTLTKPFKTITHALRIATCGNKVLVSPGRYDLTSGETFPLLVPVGVELIGDESNRGQGTPTHTTIQGAELSGINNFEAAIEVKTGGTVAGFEVLSAPAVLHPDKDILKVLVFDSQHVTVRNNTLMGNANNPAILIAFGSNSTITGNTITGATNGNGLEAGGGQTGIRIERNVITRNHYGVTLDPGTDLGGGRTGSAGKNTLSCNPAGNVFLYEAGFYAMEYNLWDHLEPTTNANRGAGTLDIDTQGTTSTIDVFGAQIASGTNCP
jgi:hypothetical protein